MSKRLIVCTIWSIVSLAIAIGLLIMIASDHEYSAGLAAPLCLALVAAAIPWLPQFGIQPTRVNLFNVFEADITVVERPEMPEAVEHDRRGYALRKRLPGRDASDITYLSYAADLQDLPVGDPTVPTYILDPDYRIVDWNTAFGLAFDNTMEGRRGQSILEWVLFLENYQDALDHGERVFADANNLPNIDVEELEFQNQRYGMIRAVKRSYRLPDDSDRVRGWLCLLKLSFESNKAQARYNRALSRALSMDYMWTEYSQAYDRVLPNTEVYPHLLRTMAGLEPNGPLEPISDKARVLDVGAGTGNLASLILDNVPDAHIVAVESNHAMLRSLRIKCDGRTIADDSEAGVLPLKQDARSLFGLRPNSFDYALMSNVLYTLSDEDALKCLCHVFRVLKPGGSLRLTGPRTSTDIDKLMKRIRRELERNIEFSSVDYDFAVVDHINRHRLTSIGGFRRSDEEIRALVSQAGFRDIELIEADLYAGQSRLLTATK